MTYVPREHITVNVRRIEHMLYHSAKRRVMNIIVGRRIYLVISLLAFGAIGCGSINSRLTDNEKGLGTSNKGDWLLHRIPEEPHGLAAPSHG